MLPMGTQNAPATFQRAMDVVLSGLKWKICLIYIDDILVFSDTWEEHLEHLKQVMQRLQDSSLFVKPKKCAFGPIGSSPRDAN